MATCKYSNIFIADIIVVIPLILALILRLIGLLLIVDGPIHVLLAQLAPEPSEQYPLPRVHIELFEAVRVHCEYGVLHVLQYYLLRLEVAEYIEEHTLQVRELHVLLLGRKLLNEVLEGDVPDQLDGEQVDPLLEELLAELLLGDGLVPLQLEEHVQHLVPDQLLLANVHLLRVLLADLGHLPQNLVHLGTIGHQLITLDRVGGYPVTHLGLMQLKLKHLHVHTVLHNQQVLLNTLIVLPQFLVQQGTRLRLFVFLAYLEAFIRGVIMLLH